MEEIWKPIFDWYEISSTGKVRSINRTIIHKNGFVQKRIGIIKYIHVDKKGYCVVSLCGKTIKVHRLVAQAFIPNPDNKPQVNHINGIKTDNRVENLEWVTNSENTKHAYNIGLNKSHRANVKLTEEQILSIRKEYIPGIVSQAKLGEKYGVTKNTIQAIISYRNWSDI